MKYRPEIDGLRAIAVLAVVFYHAKLMWGDKPLLPGGFLGVDIFFVLSGYLITFILLAHIQTSSFSFWHFYERRARRILPALLCMMLASFAVGWVFLLPQAFMEYAQSVIASVFFASNFYFLQQDSYIAEPSLLKPLLHTWSLSAEEQFYVIFPLLLLLCWRYARKYLLVILTGAAGASLLLAHWSSQQHPEASFYMLPMRGWELLAGALLASHEAQKGRKGHWFLEATMPLVGLLLIIHALIISQDTQPYPSYGAIEAVAGTMLLLWFCRPKERVTQLLSTRLPVIIGLFSYSLYLWHQPLFAFARIQNVEALSEAYKGLLIIISILIAGISWYYVEQPFRKTGAISRRGLLYWLGGATALLLLASIAVLSNEGFKQRFHPIVLTADLAKKGNTVHDAQGDCHNRPVKEACHLGPAGIKKTLYVVGDSHMRELLSPLWDLVQKQPMAMVPLTTHGCHYAPGLEAIYDGKGAPCHYQINKDRQELLLSVRPGIVVIGSRLPLYLSGEGFDNTEGGIEAVKRYILQSRGGNSNEEERKNAVRNTVRQSIIELLKHGHKVVIVYPVPEAAWNVGQRLVSLIPADHASVDAWLTDPAHWVTTPYAAYKQRTADVRAVYDSLGNDPNLLRIYPDRMVCDTQIKDRCMTHNAQNIFYRDDDHFSIIASSWVALDIMKKIHERWSF